MIFAATAKSFTTFGAEFVDVLKLGDGFKDGAQQEAGARRCGLNFFTQHRPTSIAAPSPQKANFVAFAQRSPIVVPAIAQPLKALPTMLPSQQYNLGCIAFWLSTARFALLLLR